MYDENGKDNAGNFMGSTPQQQMDAGVDSTDSLWSATAKVQQKASDDLRAHLASELQSNLTYVPNGKARDTSQRSEPFKLIFFSLISFGLIAYVVWHSFGYLLNIFVYAEDSMPSMSEQDILNRTLLIIGGLFLAGFFIWFRLVKFFSRAFTTNR
jgi:hypothetical protein